MSPGCSLARLFEKSGAAAALCSDATYNVFERDRLTDGATEDWPTGSSASLAEGDLGELFLETFLLLRIAGARETVRELEEARFFLVTRTALGAGTRDCGTSIFDSLTLPLPERLRQIDPQTPESGSDSRDEAHGHHRYRDSRQKDGAVTRGDCAVGDLLE